MNSQAVADVPLCNAVVSKESVYLSEGEGIRGGAIGFSECAHCDHTSGSPRRTKGTMRCTKLSLRSDNATELFFRGLPRAASLSSHANPCRPSSRPHPPRRQPGLFYAHSVPIGVLINLINEGLATVQVLKRHDRPGIEVTTLRISDKGRKAIG